MNKNEKFFKLAEVQADLFSKDPSTKVSALVMDSNHNIRSTGFNGLPRKFEETRERWSKPEKYDWVVHAEANAICTAARNGAKLDECTMISTLFPCHDCAKLIIQSGIKQVVTKMPSDNSSWLKSFEKSKQMFDECGVELVYI